MLPRNNPAECGTAPSDWATQFERLCAALGAPALATQSSLHVTGHEHEYAGPHRLTFAAGLALAACAQAIASLHETRGGKAQTLSLDLSAAARFLFPEANFGLRLMGAPLAMGSRANAPLLQAILPTRDGRHFVASALSASLTHRWAHALGATPDGPSLARAIAAHDSDALERLALSHRLPGAVCYTKDEWHRHEEGALLAKTPLCAFAAPKKRAGPDVPSLPFAGAQPLTGIRVVCIGRVFAGPIAARLLAEHGADVLYIDLPGPPGARAVWLEGHQGGRAAALEWREPQGRDTLRALLRESHVVLDNLRPQALEQAGVWPPNAGEARPIRISVAPFSNDGPWASLPGYDMTAQAATGVMKTEGGSLAPRLVPSILAADFLAAALAAAAAAHALASSPAPARHGHVSLARVWMWVQSLGPRAQTSPASCRVPERISVRTPWGELRRGAPVVSFSTTPARLSALGVPAPASATPRFVKPIF